MSDSPTASRHFLNLSIGNGIAFASVIVAVALSVGQCTSSSNAAKRQQQQNTVAIAVGVLSQKSPRGKDGNPEEFPADEKALRKWAVSALNDSSGGEVNKISGDAEKALVEGGAVLRRDLGTDDNDGDVLRNTNGLSLQHISGRGWINEENSRGWINSSSQLPKRPEVTD